MTPIAAVPPAVSTASHASTRPAAPPAHVTDVDLGIRVADTLDGRPGSLDRASAAATTRYALDAPAGARLQVDLPSGVGFNAWAWGNSGRTGISFAREGASWVATAPEPIRQLSLQTNAFVSRGDDIRPGTGSLEVGDITPRLSVDGVAPSSLDAPVHVVAPRGWSTAARDGAKDALTDVPLVDDTVAGDRPAGKGVATVATFTGRDVDGTSATGAGRVVSETAERATDAAASGLYTLLQLAGVAG